MLTRFCRLPAQLRSHFASFSSVSSDNLHSGDFAAAGVPKHKRRPIANPLEKMCSIPLITPVFPSTNPRHIKLNTMQEKFYSKYAPNYITAITYKTLSEAVKKTLPLKDHFCRIGTFCKVGYSRGVLSLTSLYRVNIDDVHKLDVSHDNCVPPEMLDVPLPEEVFPSKPALSSPNVPERKNKILQIMLQAEEQKHKLEQNTEDFYACRVSRLFEQPLSINIELEAKLRFLVHTYFKLFNREITTNNVNLLDASAIVDTITGEMCQRQYTIVEEFQELIETLDINERIDRLQQILNKNSSFSSYLVDLEKIVQDRIRQRKFSNYYSEVMKLSREIADGKKAKELFIENCSKSFAEKNPPQEITTVFNQEVERYSQMDEQSSESTTSKAYIEELSKIPYNVQSADSFDIKKAHEALQSEHYGMKEVKDEILELISIGKLRGNLKGKAICLVGGPGLGKTTLAASIAKAMNRKFANISLGGASDSSVLKGHRRTYVGAYAGKIIGALKQCGTNNPVILLDEIDKMGRSPQGDPSAQLLEILDPLQNSSFTDNFVDVPVDLSNVLFVCSANNIARVSKPLQDRLVKIHLSSYTNAEKKEIYHRHILRKAMSDVGLQPDQYDISPEVVEMLIHDYSLGEPGVRQLEKLTKKLLQKIVLKVVESNQPTPIRVTPENIVSYLGLSHRTKRDHTQIKKGVAIGLGDAAYGGRLTYIEAVKRSYRAGSESDGEKRSMLITGSLGSIIKQSMEISLTFARTFLKEKHNNTFLFENEVHVHAPAGASKKDGPNDSITVVTALISLALDREVKKGVAMTGQISLKGKVLKALDCKEKVLVAKREGISEMVLPKANRFEVEALSDDIKEGMKFHFVGDYEEVYSLVF